MDRPEPASPLEGRRSLRWRTSHRRPYCLLRAGRDGPQYRWPTPRDAARAIGETTELDTWSRELHARLLDRLGAAGATAVAFDLTFNEKRPGDGDAAFAAAIERAGNVVLLDWTESDVKPVGGQSEA